MKTDAEVVLMKRDRAKGRTQEQAAARAGMGVRTVRRYERAGKLPSQMRPPRSYRTRPNPFADDWPWIASYLERDPALQATTLFALLQEQHPGRYQLGQLRTLQRQIAAWRVQHGPAREVYFPQIAEPGRMAQSDFTYMGELGITVGGVPFPHLLYHLVFVYSNVEAVTLCLSETFEALAEGLESCLWQLGGVPQQHRTDHLSAAIRAEEPTSQSGTLPCWPIMAWCPPPTMLGRPTRTVMSSKPTTASSRRWIRRCACGAVGSSPPERPTSASCRTWCASAT
jgi:hypothetical protein